MNWDWDLSYLYQSFEDPAFAADLAALPELNAQLAEAIKTELPAKEKLEKLVKLDNTLSSKLDQLFSYCQLTLSVDATNITAGQYLDKLEMLFNDVNLTESAMTRYIGSVEHLDEVIASSPS